MNIFSILDNTSANIFLDALKDKPKGPDNSGSFALKDNQLIDARVLKVLSDTQAILLIDGRKLTATTHTPLFENENLKLKVVRTEGGQVLKVLGQQMPVSSDGALAEMRSLGTEGPYEKISSILNTDYSLNKGEAPEAKAPATIKQEMFQSKDNSNNSGDKILPADNAELNHEKKLERVLLQNESSSGTFKRNFSNPHLTEDVLQELKAVLKESRSLLYKFLTQKNDQNNEIPDLIKQKFTNELSPASRQILNQFLENPDLSQNEIKNLLIPEKTDDVFQKILERLNIAEEPSSVTDKPDLPVQQRQIESNRLFSSTEKLSENDGIDRFSKAQNNLVKEKPHSAELIQKNTDVSTEPFNREFSTSTRQQQNDLSAVQKQIEKQTDELVKQRPKQHVFSPDNEIETQKPVLKRTETLYSDNKKTGYEKADVLPGSDSSRKSLENIFSRLETDILRQKATPEQQESARTLSLIKKIKNLVDSFALSQDRDYSASTLKNLIRNSGLMWENKLLEFTADKTEKKTITQLTVDNLIENDVKALSMRKDGAFETIRQSVAETLKTFSESLEKLQILNNQGAEDSGKYLLPLPYIQNGNYRFGQLFIDLDRSKKSHEEDRERIIRVAFLLEMSALGHIQAGVAIYRKSVTGEFLVGNAEVKALIDEALPDLTDDLLAKGYTVQKLECRLTDPDILSNTSLVEKMAVSHDGGVSIRI